MDAEWPAPPRDGITIWHVSDTHVDTSDVDPNINIFPWSIDAMYDTGVDMEENSASWFVDAQLHTGDINDDGAAQPQEDVECLAWLNAYMGTTTGIWCVGNHDLVGKEDRSGTFRSVADWEAVYGRSAATETYFGRYDGCRILTIDSENFQGAGPTGGVDIWQVPQTTLDWLEARLTADPSTPTFFACHYPLWQQGDDSTNSLVQPNYEFVNMIVNHSNVVGWLCGHRHWPVYFEDAVKTINLGSRSNFPVISAPSHALYPPGRRNYPCSAISLFVTYMPLDGSIQVRYRNHSSRTWINGDTGSRVKTL